MAEMLLVTNRDNNVNILTNIYFWVSCRPICDSPGFEPVFVRVVVSSTLKASMFGLLLFFIAVFRVRFSCFRLLW